MNPKIFVIVALVAVLFLTRKKTESMKEKSYTLQDAEDAFSVVVQHFPKEIASQLEKLFRLETAHFKSGQFRRSGSAGMVAIKESFPYGWNSLKEYLNTDLAVDKNTENYGIISMNVRGKEYKYISFPNLVDSFLFVAWFIGAKRGGNFAAWYSLNSEKQKEYRSKMAGVRTPFVNSLYV
jgi:hypothetical protein